MRKEFHLPPEDVEHLEARGLPWETIVDGGQWLLLHNYPIPPGYNHGAASIALFISPQYPMEQIDMVWFYPEIVRNDGVGIGALCNQVIDGKTYQRWSRHRTIDGAWRPGVDCLSTHLSLVEDWLLREFRKVG